MQDIGIIPLLFDGLILGAIELAIIGNDSSREDAMGYRLYVNQSRSRLTPDFLPLS